MDLDQLLDLSCEHLQLHSVSWRPPPNLGLRRKPQSLLKRLRKERLRKEVPFPLEKLEVLKTHLQDMITSPEMVGVYNRKTFSQAEIKLERISHYLGEFSM
nr:40S ribosomal protein S15-like [Saimiri boliviensis boliviensis]